LCCPCSLYSDIHVSGCWFHYGRAIDKRLTKMGLKEAYTRQTHVKDLVHCVLGLPLLPPGDMLQALQEIRSTIHDDDEFSHQLHQLLAYVKRQTTRSLSTRAKSASLLLVLASHCQSVKFLVRQIQVRYFPVLHFPALHFRPLFSSPAFSSLARSSIIFQSCIFSAPSSMRMVADRQTCCLS